MKIKALLLIFASFTLTTYGQNVGIGTSSPNALLDVYSTSDGILIPRVALTGTASASPLSSPTTSTLVYNTATAGSGATAVSPGFYYWSGSEWIHLIDNGSLTGSTTVSNTSSANTISTTVNGVTGSTVPIINTNTLGLSGTTLTSTINGLASGGLDLSSLDNNIYNSDGTLTANRTVTMGGNVLDFAGGKVGINTAGPYNLFNIQPSSDASPGSASSYAFGINGTSGYNNITMGSDGSYAYLQSWQSRPLQINSQGNNVLFPSGNVGIGTTNASSMLTVNGTTSTTNFQMTNGATAGYLLQSDATGNGTWTNPASVLSAFGTGTQNYVTKWNNATGTTIGNSQIYDNGIRVGIGTSSPSTTLHVNGSITMGTPGNGNQNLQFSNGSGYSQIQAIDPSVAYDGLALNPNGGYVGIGNTSPDRPLTIQGSPTNNDLISYKDNGGTTRWHMNMFTTSGSSTGHYDLNFAETGVVDGRLYLQAGGNVGINSSAPAATLDVNGPLRVQGAQATHSQGVNIEWNKNNGDGSTWFLNQKGVGTGGFTFGEVSTANVVTTRMLIDASGNVGIGTTSPAQKLDVNGTTRTTNFQMTNGGTNGYILKSDASGNASWVNPASITTATTVSNTSSANTLSTTVNGVTGSTVPIINSNTLGLSGTSVTSTINGVASNTLDISSVDKNIYNSDGTLTGNRTVTMAGNTLSFTGGSVGIGTTSPAGKTSIITSSSDGNVSAWGTGQLTVGQDGTTAGALGLSYSTTNNAGYISSLSPSVAWRDLGLRANNTIFYYGGSAEGMRLSSSGYVGIGQSNPAGPLDVNGRASATSFKVSSSFTDLINNSPWYGIGLSNVTLSGQGSTAVQIGGYYGLTFVESGSTRMVINQGDVGIGTIAPDQALTIDGTAPIAEIRSGGYLQLRPTGNGWDMRLQAVSTQLNILSGGSLSSPIMSLLNGGNVGIGNSSPNGKLDIYNSADNGDGAVFAPDINADNNFTIQTYIDAAAGGGWANRTTYASGCCNNLALQPDIGTVTIGGTSGGGGSDKLVVNGTSYFNGNIGVNTSSPSVPLDIQNSTAYNEGTYEALYYNSGSSYGITPASCSSCGVSIHATGRILAAEIDATSDRRIKTNIEPVSTQPLLDIADSLAVVHYNYIDWMTKGRTTKTGFIAQEVEKNIPSAVTTSTDFIPSIFETSELVKVDGKRLLVTTHKPHALAAGDEVRIFDKDNKRYEVKVAEIISAVEFSVNDWTGDADPLFIFGKKVTDLHSVDFDQITAVAIGAVQELNKKVNEDQIRNKSLEEEISALRQRISRLSQENADTKSDVEKLKASVETLQQIIGTKAEK